MPFQEGATSSSESAGGAQVLRGSSVREMHTVQWMNPDWRSGWGIGFELERVADRVAIGHAGGIHGFTTHIFFVPAEKIGVAVCANTNTNPEAFARTALELLIPILQRVQRRMSPPDAPSPPPPADWQRYVGVYEQWMGDVEIRLVTAWCSARLERRKGQEWLSCRRVRIASA